VLAIAIGLLAPADLAAEGPDVVVSVKPIHSLVAAVMAGVGVPTLLVKGVASPHAYALRPSDAAALEEAEVVFWIGEPFETFLAKPLQTLRDESRIVDLAASEGLVLLPPREGGLWEAHHDDLAEQEHDHDDAVDGHIWLDPGNARIMTARIASVLAERDPEHAEIYRMNGDALQARLTMLDAELAARLAPVKNVPFIVFHDAYQYLEKRYGLAGVGSITVSPEQPPGARRLQEIQERIASRGARCVFSEPNVEPALVDTVIAGTPARSGVLDPEGASLAEGPDLYFELLGGIAGSLRSCLAAGS
jgi:zinc transport system substrate-binding protein